jgi:hypothetical protein
MVHHMTTTKHTDCTHPATKAARAACRKGLAPTDVARIARSSAIAAKDNAEAVDYSTVDYAFETAECDRCFGSGQPGYLSHYAGVYGGVCFKCNKSGNNKSAGRILTRAGRAAKEAHDAWIADHLMIPVTDLQPGMKFREAHSGWRTVVSVEGLRTNGVSVTRDDEGNEVRTPITHFTVTTQKITISFLANATVQRVATPEERSQLIAAIANRKGTILTPKA